MPTRSRILILQHPQEPDQILGSAKLAHLCLPNSVLKIGLSWRNLTAALGEEAQGSRWGVLYLGSGIKGSDKKGSKPLQFVSNKGVPVSAPEELDGIVVLDGSWSQAKALWWRNAWLLKLKRAILSPVHPSLYRELRKEPRKECLSTLETIAECMDALQEDPAVGQTLRKAFTELLNRRRAQLRKS